MGWRLPTISYPYRPIRPAPWVELHGFDIRWFQRNDHLIHNDFFFMAYLPARLRYNDPLMQPLFLPGNRVPIVKDSKLNRHNPFSLPETTKSKWVYIASNLSAACAILEA